MGLSFAVFGSEATPANVARALATFFRSLNSDNALCDRYAAGDAKPVSSEAIAGQAPHRS